MIVPLLIRRLRDQSKPIVYSLQNLRVESKQKNCIKCLFYGLLGHWGEFGGEMEEHRLAVGDWVC